MTSEREPPPASQQAGGGLEPISVRIPEACRLTGIGRSKLYQLIASGELEVVKIGAMTLIPFDRLRALIDRRRDASAPMDTNQEK